MNFYRIFFLKDSSLVYGKGLNSAKFLSFIMSIDSYSNFLFKFFLLSKSSEPKSFQLPLSELKLSVNFLSSSVLYSVSSSTFSLSSSSACLVCVSNIELCWLYACEVLDLGFLWVYCSDFSFYWFYDILFNLLELARFLELKMWDLSLKMVYIFLSISFWILAISLVKYFWFYWAIW